MASLSEEMKSVLPLPKHAMSYAYLRNRLIAFLLRIPLFMMLYVSYFIKDHPLVLQYRFGVTRRRVRIPSRDLGRFIQADVYTPTNGIDATSHAKDSRKHVGPVHVNFHGSGFVLKCFGADAELCSILASTMRCTVIDADYRKSPEHPFPAPVHDAEDVCQWVLSRADEFDIRNVSVGGSSAGANLSLASAVALGQRLCAVAAIAPPCDFQVSSALRNPPPDSHPHAIPPWASRYFDACYLVTASRRDDPRLSPVCAAINKGQLATRGPVYIATGSGDTLYSGGEKCIANLRDQGHQQAIFRAVRGEGHGFEKALAGTSRAKALKVFDEIKTLVCTSWLRDEFSEKKTTNL